MEHDPVMSKEVVQFLDLKRGDVALDATLGLGGHAKKILEKIGKSGKLIAFEQDLRNLDQARKNLENYKTQIEFFYDNFRYLKSRVFVSVDKILFDLGLSSPHVDQACRGFSFLKEGPLDMRYDTRNPLSAEKVVNEYSEEELRDIFFRYGEERFSRKIAAKICEQRKIAPFKTTTQLALFIEAIVPKKSKKHPATKIFQALRIEVNDELNALSEGLCAAFELLKRDGRIVIISYHSLEDRIVKKFFQKLLKPEPSEKEVIYQSFGAPKVEKLHGKARMPEEAETIKNPRARSAKLRAYKKL